MPAQRLLARCFSVAACVGLSVLGGLVVAVPSRGSTGVADHPTRGLDLTTAAGAAALRHRLRAADRLACGPALVGGPGGADFAGCTERAEQAALRSSTALIEAARATAARRN